MLPKIVKKDGIIDIKEDTLARDPSIIVSWPYPPGSTSFYVDDTLLIKPGDLILYSTEAENDPNYLSQRSAELFKSRQLLAKLIPGTPSYKELEAEIKQLSDHLVNYHQGRKRVKSERTVAFVDPVKRLIGVTEPFTFGYKPRVFGSVVRIVGFREDGVDEPTTDLIHKKAKKLYGSYDWESEWKATGAFPALK